MTWKRGSKASLAGTVRTSFHRGPVAQADPPAKAEPHRQRSLLDRADAINANDGPCYIRVATVED